MRNLKKIISVICIMAIVVSSISTYGFSPATVNAEEEASKTIAEMQGDSQGEIVYSGTEGNLEWTIDSNGHLYISGSERYVYEPAWLQYAEYIKTVEAEIDNIVDASKMFLNLNHVKSIDLSKSDFSKVKEVYEMFSGCTSLETIDFGNLTMSNVDSTMRMFMDCTSLKNFDVSSWDVRKIRYSSYMFANCTSLTDMDFSNWNVMSLEISDAMFMGCTNLKRLNLNNWCAPYAYSIGYMFADCVNLEELIIDDWKMAMTADDEGILDNCTSLGDDFIYSKFMGASGVSGNLNWNIDKGGLLTISGNGDYELEYLPLDERYDVYFYMPEWNVYFSSILSVDVNVTNITSVSNMFIANVMNKVDLQDSDFSKVKNGKDMFVVCDNLKQIYGPKNIKYDVTINLPDGLWYDAFGNEVSSFAKTLPYSMKYTKEISDEVEIVYSGTNGNIDWTIDNTGLLYVTGSGQADSLWWSDYYEYITEVDFEVSDIQSMAYMFEGLENVENIDLSKSDLSKVVDTTYMFIGCSNLEDINFGDWDLSSVEIADFMFMGCTSLKELDVTNWDVSNIRQMVGMFISCEGLTEMDLSSWNVNKLMYCESMFAGCSNLKKINLSNWYAPHMDLMRYMFEECVNLEELILDGWCVALNAHDEGILANCISLDENFEYSKFYGTSGVSGDLSWSINKDGCLTISGSGDYELEYLPYDFIGYACDFMPEWNYYWCVITEAKVNVTNITSTKNMFIYCENMKKVDFEVFDTSKVTTMDSMFSRCTSLKYVDACNWDTSSVVDMSYMFFFCENLNQVDLSRWDVSNVEKLSGLFAFCRNLTVADMKRWNAIKVTDVDYMFNGCEKIEKINLSNFDFNNVLEMTDIFDNCDNLKVVHAPKNVNADVILPGESWYDTNGNKIDKLYQGMGESVTYTKDVTLTNKLDIEINGFQVRNDATGIRTVYSVNDPKNEVVSVGLIYGLCDYANSEDMIVDSTNPSVYSYEATEAGKINNTVSEYTGATSYVMTMMFGNVNNEFYKSHTKVRAYALLEDGTYIYSDIAEYAVYDICDYLYENSLSVNETAHAKLGDLLKRINNEKDLIIYDPK